MRKLATTAISFSAAVFISHYLLPPHLLIPCIVVCAAASILAAFLKGDMRKRALLIFISAAIGIGIYYASYLNKTITAENISEKDINVLAEVTEYPEIYEDYTKITIRLIGENTPHLNAVLSTYGNELTELKPGDIVKADVAVQKADERYGEAFDRYNAENIYLLCYLNGKLELLGKSKWSFLYFPKTLAKGAKEMSEKLFLKDASPFLTSLLTGDKNGLYEDSALYAAMGKSGILHVVAVSGMHVAFLVGFITLVVRRKKAASLISIVTVWLFVPVAGATPSVIRAAFMVTTVMLAPLLKRENDAITSLSAILALMLLINPRACASVGLQLSFAAMLGMISVTPKIYQAIQRSVHHALGSSHKFAKKSAAKPIYGACAAFSATVGALAFTTPISAIYFGYVSVIGILVNVLIFWAVSLCFVMGYLSCLLGFVFLPIGTIFGSLTSVFARYIIFVVNSAADLPYGAIYTENNIFGYWLILVYIIFGICYAYKRKSGFRPVIPVCLAIISLCCSIMVTERGALDEKASFTALDIGQGQCLLCSDGNANIVIDCGGKGKDANAGDTLAGLLLGSGIQTVDVLMLTHFDDDHVNGVTRLMSLVEVKRLVIPEPSEEKSEGRKILELAEEKNVEVDIISSDAVVELGEMQTNIYTTFSQDQPSLIYLTTIGSFDILVTGDADESDEREFISAHELPDIELYVAGHHGSKTSSSEELLEAIRAEYAIVSCGYNNYGHPTKEALSRLMAEGMAIFRTDEQGNIKFEFAA